MRLGFTSSEDAAIAFIKWHFPDSNMVFEGPEYDTFRDLLTEGKDIAAAEEYQKCNEHSIAEAAFAVKLARSFEK